MKIFNNLKLSFLGIYKSKKSKSDNIAFKSNIDCSSLEARAISSRAQMNLDKDFIKPISYEAKIKALKCREINESNYQKFLCYADDKFQKALEYFDMGIDIQDISRVLDMHKYPNVEMAFNLFKNNGIPFNVADYLCDSYYIKDERKEILKEAQFDFGDKVDEYFKITSNDLENVLRNDVLFDKFVSLVKKGVNGNVAIKSSSIADEDYEKLLSLLHDEESELNNTSKAAYFINGIPVSEFKDIVELSKKYNLNCNDYQLWVPSGRKRSIKKCEEYLEYGMHPNVLKKVIKIDDEKLKEILAYANENDLSQEDVIEIYNNCLLDDKRKQIACEILKNTFVDVNTAYSLSGCEEEARTEILGYLKQGVEKNNAFVLARLAIDADKKAKVIKLLDIFEHVYDANIFLNTDLTKEERDKYLEMMKKGACTALAYYCATNKSAYDEVKLYLEEDETRNLEEIYAGFNDDEFKRTLELIRLGIPKDRVSLYTVALGKAEEEMLRAGVSYSDMRKFEECEAQGFARDSIEKAMKKGASFEVAKHLSQSFYEDQSDELDHYLNNIYPDLSLDDITLLVKIQKERGVNWASSDDKKIITKFLTKPLFKDDFIDLFDFGFLNDEALVNYEALLKRGIDKTKSLEAISLAQLRFDDSSQIDRAVEMLKQDVPVVKILFAMRDDKSFNEALKEVRTEEKTHYARRDAASPALVYMYKMGYKKEDIEKIASECKYYKETSVFDVIKYLKMGHSVENAAKISGHYVRSGFAYNASRKEQIVERDFISDMILKGGSYNYISKIFLKPQYLNQYKELLEENIEPAVAEKMVVLKIPNNDLKAIDRIKELSNAHINNDLKKIFPNPLLHKAIDELYDFDDYSEDKFFKLVKSNLSLDDIKKSANAFVKSPLKKAMLRPNLYLNDIPIEHTQKKDGHYPVLEDEVLKKYQDKMLKFFKDNVIEITRAMKYLDADTFNQMMDKRIISFREELRMLNKLDDKHYELVARVAKCRKKDGKLLNAREKIHLAKNILYHQLGYLETDYIEDMIKNGKVDLQELYKNASKKLYEVIGLSLEELEKYRHKLDFDEEYMFLLLRTQASADFEEYRECLGDKEKINEKVETLKELQETPEELAHHGYSEQTCLQMIDLLERSFDMDEKDVYKEFLKINIQTSTDKTPHFVARLAVLHDFRQYILDENNEIGKINKKTKEKFEDRNLDYDMWLNYSEKSKIDFEGNNYSISMWDRYPQKDLFMGNRTTCCTAIIDGTNGKATPIYLLNTAFNVVEVKDKNGNIVAMSRIFVGDVENQPAIILENIEVNSAFLKDKTEEEKLKLRDSIFDYIKDFSKEISQENDMKIYFSSNYTCVPKGDLDLEKINVDFIGDISSESVYLNSAPGWIKPGGLKDEKREFFKIK